MMQMMEAPPSPLATPLPADGACERLQAQLQTRLQAIARASIASLHAELVLSPKPGLVCPDDRGSHDDMDATTMMRSIVSLRHGFKAIVGAAADGASFERLQTLGIDAERAMLAATDGVNTHRGAIFNLGLLAAAVARCASDGRAVTAAHVRDTMRVGWGSGIESTDASSAERASHGAAVEVRYGAGGARREAADGFPTVFEFLWPALCDARHRGLDARRARIHVLMKSIATTIDTNLLYRGGVEGLAFAQRAARTFLERGGVAAADWEPALRTIGRAFVARRLSPGGSADLLGATLLVDRLVEAR